MAHKAVPLEPQEFLDNFLKTSCQHLLDTPPPLDGNPFEAISGAANMVESQISELFVTAVNDNQSIAHGLKMALSEKMPDVGESEGAKIDAAFFRPELLPIDGRPHWADQMVSVEFKAHGTANDPYDDREPGNDIDAHAVTRKQVRGQIIHYAEKVFEYQQRTSLIMLVIIGRMFRFTRWDRSGTIVTRAVDYVEQPQILYEMLWYLTRLSDEALGLDPTAHRVMPGSEDHVQMLQAKRAPAGSPDIDYLEGPIDEFPVADAVFKYVRENFARSLDERFPWYRLEVPHGEGTRSFLVGKPTFCAPGMAGRGTKGYVALEIIQSRVHFVWLKDAWRTHYDDVEQEGLVLQQLNKAKVANVPTLLCHGDILNQLTVTPKWWERRYQPPMSMTVNTGSSTSPSAASSSRTLVDPIPMSAKGSKRSFSELDDDDSPEECPLRLHKHYRLVVAEVGLKLSHFQSARQLLQIVLDAIVAHREAVLKTDIMHRDVSGGNILILPQPCILPDGKRHIKWRGLLLDWELSKLIPKKGEKSRARQPERTGTWQFMSVAVLLDNSKAIEISDELESFFHVILYNAVRYLRSNCPSADVGSFIEEFFDIYTYSGDDYTCGLKKATTMTGVIPLTISTAGRILKFSNPLDDLLKQLLRWFKAHYAVVEYRKVLAEAEKSQPKVTPPAHALSPSPPPPPPQFYALGWRTCEPAPQSHEPPAETDPLSPLEKPSSQTENDAALLSTHDAMLDALVEAMKKEIWRNDRATGDRVVPDFKPKAPLGPVPSASASTMKRRKLEARTCGPGLPLPRQSPSSTRPQTPTRHGSMR
ncbi:hypothetical protein PYCCODRAFT_1473777 [Trametes coccinea BRFM310]|uniref:Fungal-type protein kinase domain-containing protein n=1 Tax=Trametes coccinea (strain BRFM310) TaxID=1353009 RepID=A0A1Y2J196_TRAC3|nr:hypothetical protein PYCCODRAFT_1473777 [Trametes coccinea BRFM310]